MAGIGGVLHQRFPASPDVLPAVRGLARAFAAEAAVDPDVAALAASELATNVIVHAKTEFTLTLLFRAGVLRVEFSDGNSIIPAVVDLVVDAESGRGLRIVEAVTDRWGVDRTSDGKVVWFEVSS